MVDAPYRVERDFRIGLHGATFATYTIVHTGEGKKCHVDEMVFAYHLVDLLNEDVRRGGIALQPSSGG